MTSLKLPLPSKTWFNDWDDKASPYRKVNKPMHLIWAYYIDLRKLELTNESIHKII